MNQELMLQPQSLSDIMEQADRASYLMSDSDCGSSISS